MSPAMLVACDYPRKYQRVFSRLASCSPYIAGGSNLLGLRQTDSGTENGQDHLGAISENVGRRTMCSQKAGKSFSSYATMSGSAVALRKAND